MTFSTVLLYIHSWLRWVILLVAAVLLVKLIVSLVRKSAFDGMTRGLTAAFSGLLDLQVVLGAVKLITGWAVYSAIAGGFPRQQFEHLFVMVLAAVAAHLPARWKDKPDQLRIRNTLITVVVVLLLIVVGVMVLTGNRWVFRL